MNTLTEIKKLIGQRYKFSMTDYVGQVKITVYDKVLKQTTEQVLPEDHLDERAVGCVEFCIKKLSELPSTPQRDIPKF